MDFLLTCHKVPGPVSAALVMTAMLALAKVTPVIIEHSPVGLLLAVPT